ncbi:MAG TPA: MFS transporter [Candidatus Dormibacteraeota bacterium]|nr:MFS transporter [Candidatus Dormibacteraeota bacterium]
MNSAAKLAEPATRRSDERRWLALAFIALAQLMAALDATIVSIALPWAQRDLGATDAERQWVITAYTLAFGGLLLVGGRIADAIGRKRSFLIGLAGFAIASALGGSAGSFAVLLAARAAQGAFAALLAPTALSLLAVTFTEPHERARAFALYGAIAGSGAALGLLLGGVLTQSLNWRWCLYVNVPIAIVTALGGWRFLSGARVGPGRQFDIPGVLLVTGGLVTLVYGCAQVVSAGWGSATVIGFLAISAALLVAFVVREARAPSPLLPLWIVLDRNRGGAYLAAALAIAAMFGAFLFLTYYLQVVLRYSPLRAGLAFLPLTLASQAGSWGIASVLMPRVPARVIMAPGALVAAAGMLVLTQIPVTGGYLSHVLPAEILLGIGIACVMAPAFNIGTRGVDPRQAGVAAATVNAAVQVGASLGTALLNTIAAGATAAYLSGRSSSAAAIDQALVHGYSTATGWAAAILVLGAVSTFLLINAGRPPRRG